MFGFLGRLRASVVLISSVVDSELLRVSRRVVREVSIRQPCMRVRAALTSEEFEWL